MFLSFANPCKSPTEIRRENIFSPGGESKGMTLSPPENNCPTAEKLPKTSTVKQECQGDKGKQELHPDRSDETSNEQTLKQNEELRKKEQELQEKEKEIEELKREKENAQRELQQQAEENKKLTARIEELEEKIEPLKAEIKELKEESEKQKEELEKLKKELKEIKGNEHNLRLAAMCDQLQKNFYQIVFYPHDFSESKQSYKVVNIEDDINEGNYGLTTEEDKDQAREKWSNLKKKLRWNYKRHLRGIVQLKEDRNPTAHPEIAKHMKGDLEDGAKVLKSEKKLDKPTFGIVQDLIKMWFKTEDLVQEQE